MDITWLAQLGELPLNILLIGLAVYLWRKLETLQSKYENVLLEMGKLHGKVDTEIQINEKLDQIYHVLAEHN